MSSDNKKSGLEKRIHPRKSYRTEVVFEDEFGEGLFYVYSTDISLGGLFLASDIPVKIGTMLFLSFSLPGHKRSIRVTGKVVRVMSVLKDDLQGVGISFLGLPEMAKKRIKEFIIG